MGWAGDQRGVASVEYAVVLGTLSGGIILSFTGLGGRLAERLTALPF